MTKREFIDALSTVHDDAPIEFDLGLGSYMRRSFAKAHLAGGLGLDALEPCVFNITKSFLANSKEHRVVVQLLPKDYDSMKSELDYYSEEFDKMYKLVEDINK